MFGFLKRRRRAELRAQPFPEDWLKTLANGAALYARLPEADRRELLGHIHVFLAEKRFEGCGGQVIDDAARVLIAAQACVLLLHRETDYFPRVSAILVYPSAYKVNGVRRMHDGLLVESDEARVGEAWHQDIVVLAWDEVVRDAGEADEAPRNVVLHEFAHLLDDEDRDADGTPPLSSQGQYQRWTRVMSEAYEQLQDDVETGHETLIDSYGATNPAEFFAVLTETFFLAPVKLRQAHPELYRELAEYYQQDPAEFSATL